jgi:hypothetical protein
MGTHKLGAPRPNTDGCTELSCIYHGLDNQRKREHQPGCDVREYAGYTDTPDTPACTCTVKGETDGR